MHNLYVQKLEYFFEHGNAEDKGAYNSSEEVSVVLAEWWDEFDIVAIFTGPFDSFTLKTDQFMIGQLKTQKRDDRYGEFVAGFFQNGKMFGGQRLGAYDAVRFALLMADHLPLPNKLQLNTRDVPEVRFR